MTDEVFMYEAVKRQLEAWSDAAFPFETGGVLLGITGNGRPWIVAAAQIPSAAPKRFAYELPAGTTHDAVRQAQAIDPDVGYLGDWHSHPMDAPASRVDLATYVGVFTRAIRLREQPPLMIVMRRAPDGWRTEMLAHRSRFRPAIRQRFLLTGAPPTAARANEVAEPQSEPAKGGAQVGER